MYCRKETSSRGDGSQRPGSHSLSQSASPRPRRGETCREGGARGWGGGGGVWTVEWERVEGTGRRRERGARLRGCGGASLIGAAPSPLGRPAALGLAHELAGQPRGAHVRPRRQEGVRCARLGNPLDLCEPVGQQPLGADRREGREREDGRVVGHSDHRRILAPEEGHQQLEAGRIHQHKPVACARAPPPPERHTDSPAAGPHLGVREGRLLAGIRRQPAIEPLLRQGRFG